MGFQLQQSSDFDASFIDTLKNYKKDKKGQEEFIALTDRFFRDLEQNGGKSHFLKPEPWPANTYTPGWDLYKYHFKMPRLSGAAGQGRIVIAINQPLSMIYPVIAYSHKQYGKRPPDRTLAGPIRKAVADVQAIATQPAAGGKI